MGEPKSRSCLKSCGCGCGVIVLLLGLVLLGFGGYGWSQRPGPAEPREETLVAELGGEVLPSPEEGDDAPTPIEPAGIDWDQPAGVVRLDLRQGSFRVRPAEPGEEPRVEADYDAATHSLVAESTDGPDGWLWTVQLAPRVGFLGQLFAGARPEPRVTVVLPRERPYRLEVTTAMGQSEVELGGLPLVDLVASSSMGQHSIAFSEPTPRPLDSLELERALGQATRTGLGNASPRRVSVEHSFGQCVLDFGGAWTGLREEGRDVEVEISSRMGETVVRIPNDVPVAALEAHVDGGEVTGADAIREATSENGLRIRADGNIGSLRFQR